jgi:DNA-binding NarL/FixJ family response regulator
MTRLLKGHPERPPPLPTALASSRRTTFTTSGGTYAVLSFALTPPRLAKRLTPAEREVASAILAGKSNAEIALERGTSVRTTANQIASIYVKLGVRSRLELARQLGGRGSRR